MLLVVDGRARVKCHPLPARKRTAYVLIVILLQRSRRSTLVTPSIRLSLCKTLVVPGTSMQKRERGNPLSRSKLNGMDCLLCRPAWHKALRGRALHCARVPAVQIWQPCVSEQQPSSIAAAPETQFCRYVCRRLSPQSVIFVMHSSVKLAVMTASLS